MKFTVNNTKSTYTNFEYKHKEFGNIFAPDKIGMYSSKIKSIVDNVVNSEGITLIYSQFIDGGVVPMALALESNRIYEIWTKNI